MRERRTLESEIQTSARYDMLFLLAGVFGIYFLILSVDGITFQPLPVLLMIFGAAALFGFLEEHLGRMQILFFFSMTSVASAFVSLSSPLLRAQINLILYSMFVGSPEAETDISPAAVFLMFVMMLLFFLMESVLKTHWLLYFVTIWLLLINPMIGIEPGVPAMVLLGIFQASFWAMHGMSGRRFAKEERALERRRRRILQSGEKRPRAGLLQKWMKADEPYRGKVTFRAGLTAAALLLLLFPLSALFSSVFREPLYAFSRIEEKTFHTVLSQIGLGAGEISGRINRGNIYPVGFRELNLSSDSSPNTVLYLKGFEGGDYINGTWQNNSDLFILSSLLPSIHANLPEISLSGTDASHVLDELLYSAREALMEMEDAKKTENTSQLLRELPLDAEGLFDRKPMELTIHALHDNGPFLPYASRTLHEEEGGNPLTVSCFSELSFPGDIRDSSYGEFFSAYRDFAQNTYTRMPEGSLTKIRDLVRESGLDHPDFSSALRYVYDILEEHASYSTTPGIVPLSEDPIEHFLFESHEGYCQQYASAAVMIFRLLGFPARYAAGYAVTEGDFEKDPNGSYQAVITDYNAHAWAEVFLPESGWTPIEVTPSGNSLEGIYPAFNLGFLEGLSADYPWSLPTAVRGKGGLQGSEFFSLSGMGWPLGLLSLLTGSLILLFLLIRYFRYSPRLARGDIRLLYMRMLRHLKHQGLFSEMDGFEEDFVERLADSPLKEAGLSRDRAEASVSTAWKAFFAKTPSLNDTERAEFREVYRICMSYKSKKKVLPEKS